MNYGLERSYDGITVPLLLNTLIIIYGRIPAMPQSLLTFFLPASIAFLIAGSLFLNLQWMLLDDFIGSLKIRCLILEVLHFLPKSLVLRSSALTFLGIASSGMMALTDT